MIKIENFSKLSENEILVKADKIINYWYDHFFSGKITLDKEILENNIFKIYNSAGFSKPNIIYASDYNNPLIPNIKINEKDDNIFDIYITNVLEKIYKDSNLIQSIPDLHDLVIKINQKSNDKFNSYINLVNVKYNEKLLKYITKIYDKYLFIILYDLFTELNVINDKNFNELKEFILTGVFSLVTTNNVCVIYENPTKIMIDENKRFHCEDSSAFIFNNIEYYYWHGVEIEKNWIVNKRSITKEIILSEKNAEKRRCLKEILGSREYAVLLNIEIIDQDIDQKGNPVKLYKTVDIDDVINDYLYFANVICPSTKREYFISVPKMDNVWSAVAWTFNMNKEEYKLTEES